MTKYIFFNLKFFLRWIFLKGLWRKKNTLEVKFDIHKVNIDLGFFVFCSVSLSLFAFLTTYYTWQDDPGTQQVLKTTHFYDIDASIFWRSERF